MDICVETLASKVAPLYFIRGRGNLEIVRAETSLPMHSNGTYFAQDNDFWNNYLRGRPLVPDAFWERIFDYHEDKGGSFGTVHDAGAGNGPYAPRLRSRFDHVIVSDLVPDNVELARTRLMGASGFGFRTSRLEDGDDIAPGSVDMVFATNVMHFPDPQDRAMTVVARQLRSGGTFAAALFGPCLFSDIELQNLWDRISHEGGRQLLKRADDPATLIGIMARTEDKYNVAPLDPELFAPGAQRVHLNMGNGGIQGILPPEEAHRNAEPDYNGPNDVETFEEQEGWSFEWGLADVKEHFGSFPFISRFPERFADFYQELDEILAGGRTVKGYFPVKIILATRL